MSLLYECPDCRVTLDDHATEVRCPRCGWTLHVVDQPIEYYDRSDAIQEWNR